MYEGSEVIVPNGDLISQQVINYTLSDRMRRLELYVGVAYGSDLDHAKATIEEAVNSVENVARDPAPMVLFHGFGESSLDFRVLFWIPDFDVGLIAGSGVGMAINRALRREGIEIPFPQRDLHLKSVSPNASSAVAGGTGRAGGDAD
jgi:small-conductance mechanosensitive channel